jgi:DnaK suppressor protein
LHYPVGNPCGTNRRVQRFGDDPFDGNGDRMTQKQLEHLEKRLLRARERVTRSLAHFEESGMAAREDDGDLSLYSQHPADEGTDTIEQEKEFLLATKEGRLMALIDAALLRIYKEPEAYGQCQDCGEPIQFERLDLVPWARLCIECKRAEESEPRQIAA